MNYSINTDELKNFIVGREIELAKQLGIVVEGIGNVGSGFFDSPHYMKG
jgi:hypothetical protein